jgi:hypothetical protein
MNTGPTIQSGGKGTNLQLAGINIRLFRHEEFSARLSILHNQNDVTIFFTITDLEFFSPNSFYIPYISSIQSFFTFG